jgi:hypothetical protein
MVHSQKIWNDQQKEFRQILLSFKEHKKALELFMTHHGVLHASALDESLPYSYEDEILSDMTDDQLRRLPANCEHSVAWNIWHIARIEDVTMNMLVHGVPQLYDSDAWFERLRISAHDTGNAMSTEAIVELSNTIDLEELCAYRLAVGRRTREIVKQLTVEDLKKRVDPTRLQQLRDVGAVVEEAEGLIEYWGNRDIAGLLLMPATRHNCVHLNEAMRLKHRLK